MDNIEVKIETKHFKASPGYIFDDSPLDLALREMYPNAFKIMTWGTKVAIIHNKEDKEGISYYIGKEYHPRTVDTMIKQCKEEGKENYLTVTLSFKGTQENSFYHKPQEDHVEKVPQELPKDLFSE